MTDKNLENVIDNALEALPNTQEEVVEEVVQQPEEPERQEKPQEQNFKQLRTRAERAEQERDEAIRIARQYESYAQNFNRPQQPQPEPEEELGDDEIVEVKHLKKYQKKLEARLDHYEQQLSTQSAQQRAVARNTDFHSVVTKTNIDKLVEQYPQIARTLETSPDLDSKLDSAYLLIQKLILGESEKSNKYDDARSTAQANNAKPKPATSIANQQNSALAKVNAYQTEADREKRRRQVEAEMDALSRGYSSN